MTPTDASGAAHLRVASGGHGGCTAADTDGAVRGRQQVPAACLAPGGVGCTGCPGPLGTVSRALHVFQLGTETESTQATTDIYEREAALEVDYGPLREDLKVTGYCWSLLTPGKAECADTAGSLGGGRALPAVRADAWLCLTPHPSPALPT